MATGGIIEQQRFLEISPVSKLYTMCLKMSLLLLCDSVKYQPTLIFLVHDIAKKLDTVEYRSS